MASNTLLGASVVTFAVGVAYGYVAYRLGQRRDVEPDALLAMRAFTVWWGALAVNIFLVAFLYLAMGLGAGTLEMQVASSIVQRLLLAISLVGLMTYMSYVLTGRLRLILFAVVYALYFAFAVGTIVWRGPAGVDVHPWRTDLHYASAEPAWASLVGLFLIVLPPVVSSVAYLRLFFHAKDRSQRYRIVVVSSSLLLWWVLAVVAGQEALLDDQPLQLAVRALSLATAVAVLAAFLPPAWVQQRFAVEPYAT